MVPKTAPVEGVGSAFLTSNLSKFNDMNDIGRSQPSQDEITFIDMKTIKPEMTDWLGKDWLAAGELNLIAGMPGLLARNTSRLSQFRRSARLSLLSADVQACRG
jgi:hypothetical protein